MKYILLILLTSCALKQPTRVIYKTVKPIYKTIKPIYEPTPIKIIACTERFLKMGVKATTSSDICEKAWDGVK